MRALLLVLAIVLLGAARSWAVLGQSLDSLAADQQRLHGEVRSTARDGFSVHEIASADGTLVRQYAAPSGVVFGVAWQGPFVPALSPLLGSYFAEYQRAVQSPVRRRAPLALRTDHLVIETGGHMRGFHGRVFVPGLVPAAVSEGVVR
ncbi:MAG TPA: DUF2844 domain-containing protein [Vicinamibacteria bacterium]|nr:DUF2844 domain-containing protein [Vicinamibacteria bacterium]